MEFILIHLMVVLTSLTYLLIIAHNLPQNGIVRVKVGSVVVLYWFVYRFNGRFCDEKENRPVHEVEDGELVTRGLRMKQSWRRQGKRVGVKWRTSKNYLATQTDYIEGAANLDLLIDEIDRMEKLVDQASTLHDRFSTDVKSSAEEKGITRGSQKVPLGRPLKGKVNDSDLPDNFQPKCGRAEHTKKRNLRLHEQLNQPDYFKH